MSDDDNVITLHDGTRISTRTGRPIRAAPDKPPPGYVALPSNAEAVHEVVRVRKRLADLPDIPARMNIIGAVAAYHLFGLDTLEIAHALNATERQVANIMMTQAFTDLITAMQQNIVETQQEDVRALLAMNAANAAQRVIDTLSAEDEAVALSAAKDILDRAGHRPVDVVEHRHRVDGGLTIEYVRKSVDDTMPTLDLTIDDTDTEPQR